MVRSEQVDSISDMNFTRQWALRHCSLTQSSFNTQSQENQYSALMTSATMPCCGLINRKYTIKFCSSNMFLNNSRKGKTVFTCIKSKTSLYFLESKSTSFALYKLFGQLRSGKILLHICFSNIRLLKVLPSQKKSEICPTLRETLTLWKTRQTTWLEDSMC